MKPMIIGVLSALVFSAGVIAADTPTLSDGDRLEIANGRALTVPALREALRSHGYYGFSQGDHSGHIIKISAYGPDRFRYRIKAHMYSGEVTELRLLRHLF